MPIPAPARNWHCSLVMKRDTVPLVSGRMKYIDVCRNCGWQCTETYTANGQILRWKNDGFPARAIAEDFGVSV